MLLPCKEEVKRDLQVYLGSYQISLMNLLGKQLTTESR